MDSRILIILACLSIVASAWTIPYYRPHRRYPLRVTRYARQPQQLRKPMPVRFTDTSEERWQRPKREHDDFYNHDEYDNDRNDDKQDNDDHKHNDRGATGPIHTFVKTDKNANYKWGVRHHVGQKFSP